MYTSKLYDFVQCPKSLVILLANNHNPSRQIPRRKQSGFPRHHEPLLPPLSDAPLLNKRRPRRPIILEVPGGRIQALRIRLRNVLHALKRQRRRPGPGSQELQDAVHRRKERRRGARSAWRASCVFAGPERDGAEVEGRAEERGVRRGGGEFEGCGGARRERGAELQERWFEV